ncbi:type I-E CRISPR-associated protein Cse2/CasB [Amycolatopsis sp. FDAARGOS 1241]|uniref:type I-E CRISPR-associated protein Cse2/CasB n=1 Tax=Amycolatopsis sp. FDAARGOS 1241 TaxID=2778070 RepID=UPI00195165A6|nr:type I-E CRISPR-associated protein Cse2/CasB [Amycolatopsis sp. FDAARGOS 1241]QRP46032.1 type I-E CRISPR-associated protein Cse2/CasB [Amycolatopsis sp. FDAARGOS 1241]
MTTTPTEPTGAARPTSPRRPRRLGPLGRALDGHITRLQRDYLRGSSAARADLARLRRGLGKPAGSVPEIWSLTVGAVPEELSWHGDEPSWSEQAAHAALTLYALHQQSLPTPAHVPGTELGYAVGRLRFSAQRSADAVTRRFMAVATAGSITEVLTHLRGLITLLRTERRGVDYAALADDLARLVAPGSGAAAVRLAWGRAFYRTGIDGAGAQNTEPTTATTHGEE